MSYIFKFVVSRFQSSLLMSFPARVIWCLAAHFGIFHLHAKQSPISAHAELVPLQAFIKIHVSCRVRDACGVEHDWSIEHYAVFLQKEENIILKCPQSFIFIRFTQLTLIHTYSPELDASTHFELYSPAHDVDPLISTNDSLAVPFDVQVRGCTAGDLQSETITHFFRLLNLPHTRVWFII